MAYLRAAWGLRWIKGRSHVYVYGGECGIEDFGGLSDSGLAELLCDVIAESDHDSDYKKYLMEKVAEALAVELREKPASFEQQTAVIEGKCCPQCLSVKIKRHYEMRRYANGVKRVGEFKSCKKCGFEEKTFAERFKELKARLKKE